jgi:hypothetical protein
MGLKGIKSFSLRLANLKRRRHSLHCSNDQVVNSAEGHGSKGKGLASRTMLDQTRPLLDIQVSNNDSRVDGSLQANEIKANIGQDTGLLEDMTIVDAFNIAHDEAMIIMNSAVASFQSTSREFKKNIGVSDSFHFEDAVPGCLGYKSHETENVMTCTSSAFASVCETVHHLIEPAQEEFEILWQENNEYFQLCLSLPTTRHS